MLTLPIQYARGVGPHRAGIFSRLGITTFGHILYHLPSRYEDRLSLQKIAHLIPEQSATVRGTVVASAVRTTRSKGRRFTILEVTFSDGSGYLRAKWFNQPYLGRLFEPRREVILHGTVKASSGRMARSSSCGGAFEMNSPDYELTDEHDAEGATLHAGRIVPVYRTAEGISQRQFRSAVHSVLEKSLPFVQEHLPEHIISEYHLPGLAESLRSVHFPAAPLDLEQFNRGVSSYHQRLAFDELFSMQLGLAALKRDSVRERGISLSSPGRLMRALRTALPFTLTTAQERVLGEILSDMRSPVPMSRLLQGDVGSGKTVVALMAMLASVECGYQSALMAPTEVLAEQHFLTIRHLVEPLGVRVCIITGSHQQKAPLAHIPADAQIVIGTHALIQEEISFGKLGLVVIDEQHRFGVLQRARLKRKGVNPDSLIMTATPIPRTLALTLYGDLDCSVIDELPPRRSPVKTIIIDAGRKERVYRYIEEETRKGRQVYVVFPLIDESEKTDLRAAITGKERLQAMFPNLRIGLLHGRMKADDRENVISQFRAGALHVLVSTTVIEVGVDIPNATVMAIVHAERFGLAQLHQLRGRVGRGADQSYCVLLNYGASGDARKRLDAMARTTDGFRIAEDDLAIRGPGELLGTRQSGIPDLKAANLVRDVGLLETARREAFALIERDHSLERFPLLRKAAEGFWGERAAIFRTA